MTLNGGLIGCGYIANQQMAAWAQVRGGAITAVCDIDEAKARDMAERFGVEAVHTDYRRMLDAVQPDFVDIATRPMLHLEMVREAAARGIHVLCQKPVAESMPELEQMIDACDEAGVRFMVNENFRHRPWFRKMKELIGAGALGRVFYALIFDHHRMTLPEPRFGGQPYFAQMPRLMVYEMGIHYLDTARYLFGEASQIYARLARVSTDIAGEDLATAMVSFGDMEFLMDLSWCSVQPPTACVTGCRARIEGERATAELGYDGLLSLHTDSGCQAWRFSSDGAMQSFVATQQHFIDCLETGSESETSGRETVKTMELVFAAYASAARREPVKLTAGKAPAAQRFIVQSC